MDDGVETEICGLRRRIMDIPGGGMSCRVSSGNIQKPDTHHKGWTVNITIPTKTNLQQDMVG